MEQNNKHKKAIGIVIKLWVNMLFAPAVGLAGGFVFYGFVKNVELAIIVMVATYIAFMCWQFYKTLMELEKEGEVN